MYVGDLTLLKEHADYTSSFADFESNEKDVLWDYVWGTGTWCEWSVRVGPCTPTIPIGNRAQIRTSCKFQIVSQEFQSIVSAKDRNRIAWRPPICNLEIIHKNGYHDCRWPLLRPHFESNRAVSWSLLNSVELKYFNWRQLNSTKHVSTKVRLFVRWWCAVFPRAFVPILLRLYGSAERHWKSQFCSFLKRSRVSKSIFLLDVLQIRLKLLDDQASRIMVGAISSWPQRRDIWIDVFTFHIHNRLGMIVACKEVAGILKSTFSAQEDSTAKHEERLYLEWLVPDTVIFRYSWEAAMNFAGMSVFFPLAHILSLSEGHTSFCCFWVWIYSFTIVPNAGGFFWALRQPPFCRDRKCNGFTSAEDTRSPRATCVTWNYRYGRTQTWKNLEGLSKD